MTNQEAIEWLKIAVPNRALTHKEYKRFIIAVNMAKDLFEGKRKETNMQQIETNRDYIISALQRELDDGGAEEAVIYNNINCPYLKGDQRAECEKLGKEIGWGTCTECKTKWLDSEPDE